MGVALVMKHMPKKSMVFASVRVLFLYSEVVAIKHDSQLAPLYYNKFHEECLIGEK